MPPEGRGFESHPLRQERYLFCIQVQKRYFFVFKAKNRQNMCKISVETGVCLVSTLFSLYKNNRLPYDNLLLMIFIIKYKLIIICLNLEICFRMFTNRAEFGSGFAYNNMTTVCALPDHIIIS